MASVSAGAAYQRAPLHHGLKEGWKEGNLEKGRKEGLKEGRN
jgi:hypothetical protein